MTSSPRRCDGRSLVERVATAAKLRLAFALCLVSLIGIAFDPNQVAALLFGVPFVGACYAFFYFKYGRRRSLTRADAEVH